MNTLTVPVNERDHIRGSPDAPVIMVEYADFECPYCGLAYPAVKKLENEVGDILAVVFRHFPLATVHPHAELAAEAAEAAGAQGRFWEMHDVLFENQDALAPGDLMEYAAALDLDEARFAQDLSEHRHAPKVRDDFMSGVRSGVNGTPTFFVNGVRHQGAYDAASLLASIMQAAASASSSQRSPHPQSKSAPTTRHR
jgi:protein-disulfide isomerase